MTHWLWVKFTSSDSEMSTIILVHWASKQADLGCKSGHPAPLAQTEDPVMVGAVLHPGFFGDASLLEPPEQPVVCFDELI